MRQSLPSNPSEATLSFRRRKRRWLPASLIFRGSSVARALFGSERALRFELQAAKALWRVAYENAGAAYGVAFREKTMALTTEVLERWVPVGASVLDIGCGRGHLVSLIAARVESALGVDLDARAIGIARRENRAPHVRFELADATRLPAAHFDVAVMSHLLEHIDDPDALLQRVQNIAPRVVVEVPQFGHDPLDWVRLDMGVDFSSDADHVREYTREVLVDQLTRNGWRPIDWTSGRLSIAALAERSSQ